MPVILCPKCQGKLRMPENVEARRVKCPTCGNIFLSNEARAEGEPSPEPKVPPPSKSPASKLSSALGNFEKIGGSKKKDEVVDDFEVIDEEDEKPKSKPRRRDEEEEERPRSRDRDRNGDDRSRSRRPRDEDEEERRPSRRHRDEEEEDDERPRSRSGRNRDDEDDDRRRSSRDDDRDTRGRSKRRDSEYDDGPRTKAASFHLVRVALLMNSIASWTMGGAMACMTLALGLVLMGIRSSFPGVLTQIAGIGAIGFVVVTGISYGFCISGPNRNGTMGFAIASLAITGARLILMIVVISQAGSASGMGFGAGLSSTVLGTITLAIPGFGIALFFLFQGAPIGSEFLLLILLVGVEIAQFIVFSLYMKAAAVTSRDRDGESNAGGFALIWSICSGVMAFAGLLIMLLVQMVRSADFAQVALSVFMICSVGGLGGLYTWQGFVSQNVNEGLDESTSRKKKKRRRR